MIEEHLDNIFEHFNSEYPKEACGLIGVFKGKTKWFPCRNTADQELSFIIDKEDYLAASLKSDIVAVVHSHPDISEEPSSRDIAQCNTLKLDYYIFSWPKGDMYYLTPEKRDNPLIGRIFEWGYKDCWSLFRDYYQQKLSILLKPHDSEVFNHLIGYNENWWEKGKNYFVDLSKDYGFEEVLDGSLIKNDGLLFSIQSNVPNHCGIYLENDLFIHHATNRISCRENLYPFWGKNFTKVMRYTCKT